ncbi:MAG: hypothetical protein AAFX10_17480, partial [Pseudomonadota bacterium]
MPIAHIVRLVIACLAVTALSAGAQEPGSESRSPEAVAAAYREEMIARLNLSDTQIEAVMPILDDGRQQIRDLTTSHRGGEQRPTRAEMRALRAEIQEIREQTRNALAEHLTEEQL